MQKKKCRCWFIFWLCLCLSGMCGCFEESAIYYPDEYPNVLPTEPSQTQSVTVSETKAKILVHVCGAVKVPGVYLLDAESRVYQAVESAGGLLEDADSGAVNLADILTDGQQIWIPAVGETVAGAGTADEGRISINRAKKEELMQLPGIGESRAEAIIAYREEHGAFSKPEDIMFVPGIKEAAYAKLKDRITAD